MHTQTPLPTDGRRRGSRRPGRRASALILVILLLVLLGLVGTALVATTRQDRVSSYSYMNNGQVDMYLDGVSNIAKSIIVGDLFGTGGGDNAFRYRTAGTNYRHSTSHNWYDNRWLASRVPEWHEDIRTNGFEGEKFNWPQISLPSHIQEEQNIGWLPMVSPMNPKDGVYRLNNAVTSVDVDGVDYPALRWAKDTDRIPPAIAGDADGDGMADSGLWPMTRQPRDGITYYGALRIIDNAAAINVNTAWLRDHDLSDSLGQEPNKGYFPSNIGIGGVLQPDSAAKDLAALNKFRFGGEDEPERAPYDDTGKKRPEYDYATQAEAFYNGLGARLFNPGLNKPGVRYRPFSSLDHAALGYHFVLPNPDVAPSPLEKTIFDSVYGSAANYDQDPSKMFKAYARRRSASGQPTESHLELAARWWGENFDYDNNKFSSRPLLVTTNAVSPAIIQAMVDIDGDGVDKEPINPGMLRYHSRGDWTPGTTYKFGEVVRYNGYHYAMIKRSGGATQPSGKEESNDTWEYQPFSPIASRASLNTSTFRELWRNFWVATVVDPSGYNSWSIPTNVAKGMTRSPIRTPESEMSATPKTLDPQQVAQLRAAIAAVNVLGMRDQGPNVISRTITLYESRQSNQSSTKYDVNNKARFRVNVFSNKPQPFVSEVYEANGYLMIELYNPYDKEIVLNGFRFGLVRRQADGQMELEDMGEIGELDPEVSRTIKARGFLVFESDPERRAPAVAAALQNSNEKVVAMPKLANVPAGGQQQLVLLRPRKANGQMSTSTKLTDYHDEGTFEEPNLIDFVPLDEICLPASRGGRYAREISTVDAEWTMTYPGFGVRSLNDDGTRRDPGAAWDGNAPTPGARQVASHTRTVDVALLKPGWPGEKPLAESAGANVYPFGMFAYAGDVLKVPYAGAYTIHRATDEGEVASEEGMALEMNAPTVDLLLTDEDYKTPPLPTIARFIPRVPSLVWTNGIPHWSADIVEYFTTRVPHQDYMPNVEPDRWGTYDAYGNFIRFQNKPTPVANSVPGRANQDEPLFGVEGLVNVNTAPAIVLAQLPLVMTADGTKVDHVKTLHVAKKLASINWNGRWRRFETMIDLDMAIKEILDRDFGIQPPLPDDFEVYWANAIRLSNLVTFRSDSFTVYALVEGWRDANTPQAKRVVQRRAAFIIDRSCVTETNREPRIINIATN